MTHGHRAEPLRRQLLRDAAVTLATVLLAFAAFDDITDTATTFTFEWVGLAACGAWLLIVSWRLLRSEHRWLGSVSVVALVAAVGAGSAIRPGTGPFQIEYLPTIAGLLWFLGLVGILTWHAWRRPINTRPNPTMEPTARRHLPRAPRNERAAAHRATLDGRALRNGCGWPLQLALWRPVCRLSELQLGNRLEVDLIGTVDETQRARVRPGLGQREVVRHAGGTVRLDGPIEDT